jgi:type IV pilus assembly protein PilW
MIRGNNQSGLTFIELMIAMVIAGLLMAVMVMAFRGQSRTHNTQQEISTLQEDMWSALQLISRDIRMAGYDRTATGIFGIIKATATEFQATQDINENGVLLPVATNPEEDIRYALTGTSLGRSTNGGALQPVIDNITQLAFEYESITKNGNNPWVWNWSQTPGDLTAVRVVKVCMQGRTPRQTSTTSDSSAFNPPLTSVALNWTPANPGEFQWRTMCIEVQCRNFQD